MLSKKDYKGIEGGTIKQVCKFARAVHHNGEYEVILNKHWNPASLMIAHFDPGKPDIITINEWNLYSTWANRFRWGRKRRYLSSNVATNVHEFFHLADYRAFHLDFGHAGNSSVGKDDYVPYYAGKIAHEVFLELFNERN